MSEQPFSPGADPQWAGSTRAVALGRPAHRPGAPVNPGIELTSTYLAGGDPVYARGGNATWAAFEEVLGSLEGGCALVYASGMAAIAAVFALVPVGGVVVVPDNAYNTTLSLADELLASGRLECRRFGLRFGKVDVRKRANQLDLLFRRLLARQSREHVLEGDDRLANGFKSLDAVQAA